LLSRAVSATTLIFSDSISFSFSSFRESLLAQLRKEKPHDTYCSGRSFAKTGSFSMTTIDLFFFLKLFSDLSRNPSLRKR
jgi:hypothetical protein